MAHKCEIGIVSLFSSSTVKGFGELCTVYKTEIAYFGPCFDCLSIQVGFTVAPVYSVAIEVSNTCGLEVRSVCIWKALSGDL